MLLEATVNLIIPISNLTATAVDGEDGGDFMDNPEDADF